MIVGNPNNPNASPFYIRLEEITSLEHLRSLPIRHTEGYWLCSGDLQWPEQIELYHTDEDYASYLYITNCKEGQYSAIGPIYDGKFKIDTYHVRPCDITQELLVTIGWLMEASKK